MWFGCQKVHVGLSEAALRSRLQQMELLLHQFQEVCEQQVNKPKRKAVAAMDETVFGDFLIFGVNGLNLRPLTIGGQVETSYYENLQGIGDTSYPFFLFDRVGLTMREKLQSGLKQGQKRLNG
jgi:hypothetical protein